MKKFTWLVLSVFLLASLAACGTYYKVTDVQSDKTYYTDKVKRMKDGGVMFTDKRRNSQVSLNSSEVQEIPKSEYKQALKEEK